MKFSIFNFQFPINFQFSITTILNFLVKLFLFILPWQTIWIYQESFFGDYKNQFGTLGFYVSEILLWLIVLLFIILYWKQRKFSISNKFSIFRDRIFVFSVFLFIIYCLASAFWAFDFSIAWQQALRIMEMFLLFFILSFGLLSKKEIARWIILGSVIPIFLGLFQFIFQFTFSNKYLGLTIQPIWEAGSSVVVGEFGRLLRAYGSFAHPNIFAGYLVIVFLVSILFFGKKEKSTLISYFFIGLLMLTLFFTFSRAALLTIFFLILGFLIYSFINKNKIINQIAIFSLVLFFVLLFSLGSVFQSRILVESVNEIQSIQERVGSVSQALNIWSENFWFGVGAGNYIFALHNLNPNFAGWLYQPVHNVCLLMLAELGLVGILLFIFLIITFFVFLSSRLSKKDFFWLIYAIFCLIILLFLDHYLWSFYIGLLLNSLFFSLILVKK